MTGTRIVGYRYVTRDSDLLSLRQRESSACNYGIDNPYEIGGTYSQTF